MSAAKGQNIALQKDYLMRIRHTSSDMRQASSVFESIRYWFEASSIDGIGHSGQKGQLILGFKATFIVPLFLVGFDFA